MCEFEPGDPIICVAEVDPRLGDGSALAVGQTYTCEAVYIEPHDCPCKSNVAVEVMERPDSVYCECHFAKPKSRDLSAWLETAATDTDHLDKPIKTPARPKVDALLKRVQSGAFG